MPVQPRHLRFFSQQVTRLDQNHLARTLKKTEQSFAVNRRKVLNFIEHGVRLLNSFLVAFLLETDAQLFVQTRLLATQALDRFACLVLKTRLTAIHMVEAASQFAGEFDVRNLILANRHFVGTVDQDIGTHQQRITEEAVSRQILAGELFLLILVGRHPFQPAERGHHRHQQMQFGMLRHFGLDEQGRLIGIDTGCQPVDDHIPGGLLDALRIVVMRRQCMPVGDEKQARVFMLEFDPVFEHPVVMAKMERAGGAHAGENTFSVHSRSIKPKNSFNSPRCENHQRIHDLAKNAGEQQHQ